MQSLSDAEAAEILEKAADLYESDTIDWCAGSNFRNGVERLSACAQGAIYLAVGAYKISQGYRNYAGLLEGTLEYVPTAGTPDVNEWDRLENRAEEAIRIFAHNRHWASVPRFNDTQGRTKQEVINQMKDCAKDLRNKA